MFTSLSKAIAPGFYCRNESDIPIIFVLSQLTPLHWAKVEPGEKKHLECGRVFFTCSVDPWVEGSEPTQLGVAARLGAIVSTTVLFGGIVGIGLVGALSGVTSIKGVKMDGVLANGRIMVIRGRKLDTGIYELYIHGIENA